MIHDPNQLCQQYLAMLYHNIHGHGASDRQNKNIPETYGEILYPSVDLLLEEAAFLERDVFVDLGSGLGKVVIQVFLKSVVKAAVGIEIIPDLHRNALTAAERVQRELPHFYAGGRELNFILGSFLTTPLPMASVVLVGSPCFSPRMLYQLANLIDKTPSIRLVLTLRPLCLLQRLSFTKAIRMEGSWDTTLCYVYRAKEPR